MPGISALRSAIPFQRGAGIVWMDADIVSASVEYTDPTKVLINFSYNLDGTSTPDPSVFTLAGKTITNVLVAGGTITLTVSVAYAYGDVITVDYTIPATNRLKQDVTGFVLNSWVGQAVANYVNEADVATYVGGLVTTLSDDILGKINTFVAGYKSDDGLTNLSDAYDIMHYLGNETAESSLRNLVKRAHDATAVNAPVHTPLEGWTGDAISSYIDTNYNASSEGSKYTLNNASLGVYLRSDVYDNTMDFGAYQAVGTHWAEIALYNDVCYIRVNATSPTVSDTFAAPDTRGMFIGTRNSATTTQSYRNKVLGDADHNSTAIPDANFTILKISSYESNRQTAFAFAGNHRTQTSVNYLTDRFEALMDSNGKGIIA